MQVSQLVKKFLVCYPFFYCMRRFARARAARRVGQCPQSA